MSNDACSISTSGLKPGSNIYLPIFTKDLATCQEYLDHPITDKDYSHITGGYICIPSCVYTKDCPNPILKYDSVNNNWVIHGTPVKYDRMIYKQINPSSYDQCLLLDPNANTCDIIDNACCGKGFGGSTGVNCDRLDANKLYLQPCYNEGSRSECCDHGQCINGFCTCDPGYINSCCECDIGYVKQPDGSCRPDMVQCCSSDKTNCDYVLRANCTSTGGTPIDDCYKCYPPNQFYCDNTYSCGTRSSYRNSINTSTYSGISPILLGIAILVLIYLGVVYICR